MTVGNIGKHLTQFHDVQVLEDDTAFSETRKRKSTGKSGKKKGLFKRLRSKVTSTILRWLAFLFTLFVSISFGMCGELIDRITYGTRLMAPIEFSSKDNK